MPSVTLTISYKKNTGIVFSAQDLKTLFFTGIELKDQFGNPMPDEQIDLYIESAQKELQDYLSIKLCRQAYKQTVDFFFDDWIKWSYIPTLYPVVTPKKLQGYINSTLQIDYPEAWLSAKRQQANPIEEDTYHRTINLVPITGSQNNTMSGAAVYVGVAPFIGYFGNRTIPNYWTCSYITGFQKIPKDIVTALGLMASKYVLYQLGDIISGLPGIASKSIGIDGLSQSVNTTNSSNKTGFGARIDAYDKQLDQLLPRLVTRYKGITFGCL